ncbi:hypothetical protein DOM22_13620 [Bdellovibrio sp. ZAP7]|uniref:hypothetical protein n=1 Tax=Bdellovibrio sp. ZAP7 TaxID=2231053 RepID=UPI00115902CB|nr:hypothetical protein [Bdellovibrio sp. ZAP7]QDK46125.1 hypothetical protein DOM22_13620 [Bdellovibrio sp. ZAP7]
MFKIISSLIGLFMGSGSPFGKGMGIDFKGIQASVFDELAVRARKPVLLLLLGIGSIVFFCFGSFMAILDATRQYDRTGHIYATSTLWTGIILAAVTAGGYAWIFMREWPGLKKVHAQKKAEEEAEERERAQQANYQPSDIEGAIAAILMDFVESRRSKRETRYAEREQRRAERQARREARFEQREAWRNEQSSSSQEPPRH